MQPQPSEREPRLLCIPTNVILKTSKILGCDYSKKNINAEKAPAKMKHLTLLVLTGSQSEALTNKHRFALGLGV